MIENLVFVFENEFLTQRLTTKNVSNSPPVSVQAIFDQQQLKRFFADKFKYIHVT